MGGIDGAVGESGLLRRSGSGWIATVSKTFLDAPIPRASKAFILA